MRRGDVLELWGDQTIVLEHRHFVYERFALVLHGTTKRVLHKYPFRKWKHECDDSHENKGWQKTMHDARQRFKRAVVAPAVLTIYFPVVLVLSPVLALALTVDEWVNDGYLFGKRWSFLHWFEGKGFDDG